MVPGGTQTFRGEDDEEILARVVDHDREEHAMARLPPEVVERVRALTRDVA